MTFFFCFHPLARTPGGERCRASIEARRICMLKILRVYLLVFTGCDHITFISLVGQRKASTETLGVSHSLARYLSFLFGAASGWRILTANSENYRGGGWKRWRGVEFSLVSGEYTKKKY